MSDLASTLSKILDGKDSRNRKGVPPGRKARTEAIRVELTAASSKFNSKIESPSYETISTLKFIQSRH